MVSLYRENPYLREDVYILVGSIPAAVVGLMFEKRFELIFSNVPVVGLMLILTGLFLWLTRFTKESSGDLSIFFSFIIGCAQAIAIIPGISRSGWTIGMGLFLAISRKRAAEFSFLLSIPVILGATLLKLNQLSQYTLQPGEIYIIIIGTVSAFAAGWVAILTLLKAVKAGKLSWFSYYCVFIGLMALLLY